MKSAGYAAEYGGSTGGVINVITKSGSNAWHGGVLTQFEQRSWGGDERPILVDSLTSNTYEYVNPEKDDEWRVDPGLFLSGPILKDRLWFFGSYQPGIRSTERTVTFTNGVTNTFPQDYRVNYGTANITGDLNAGNGSNGLMTVSGSALVNARNVNVGLNAGATNSRLTVTGGTLSVTNGILVSNSVRVGSRCPGRSRPRTISPRRFPAMCSNLTGVRVRNPLP